MRKIDVFELLSSQFLDRKLLLTILLRFKLNKLLALHDSIEETFIIVNVLGRLHSC